MRRAADQAIVPDQIQPLGMLGPALTGGAR